MEKPTTDMTDAEIFLLLNEEVTKYNLDGVTDDCLESTFQVTPYDAYNWERPVTLVLNTR